MSNIILPDGYRDKHWKTRAIHATDGNKSLLGCFVLAVLGMQHGVRPPRFGSTANIDKDGLLYSHMQAADGQIFQNHCLGPVEDVRDNFRRLADHLKLSDSERVELLGELKKWIRHDARADRTVKERGLGQ